MTPEEIKKLLLQSKTEGLSGATVADLQRQTNDPLWRPKVAKAAHRSELGKQAVTGLQNAMGPAAMLMPSMGMLAEGAPTAIGLGAELGDVAKKGFVSNSNFDNTMLAMLGVSGMPLLGRKGEGKLYSKAVTLADEQGMNLHSMTPTFLSRWLKKNDIKPAEAKMVKESNTLYHENAKKPFELSDPDYNGIIPNAFISEDIGSVLKGKVHSYKNYEYDGLTPTIEPSRAFSDITFPSIIDELEKQNVKLIGDFEENPTTINNLLIKPYDDINKYQYSDHWGGDGPIHARVSYSPTKDYDRMVGILAEVQSDAAKRIDSSELPKTTFLSDYPNIATKQGLLQLIQQSDANMPGKPLQVVWPSGELQREVNRSDSTAYDNIYNKRVTKAMSEALGDDAVIEQLRHPPFTPIEMRANQYDNTKFEPNLLMREGLSGDEWKLIGDRANETVSTLYKPEDFEYQYKALGYPEDGAQALALDDYYATKNTIEDMLVQQLLKQKAGTVKESPSKLFSTTIPAEKVSRLAKDGIPLWMLPIGMGISSQMSYNKESPQQ